MSDTIYATIVIGAAVCLFLAIWGLVVELNALKRRVAQLECDHVFSVAPQDDDFTSTQNLRCDGCGLEARGRA